MTSHPQQTRNGVGHGGSRAEENRGRGITLRTALSGREPMGDAKAGPKGAGYLKCGKKNSARGVILDFAQPTFLPPPPRAGQKPTHD